jgi:hypothetical protein
VTDRERQRRRIVARLRRVIAELEQIIIDTQGWNGLHPGEPPLDCEGDRVLLHEARRDLAKFIEANP